MRADAENAFQRLAQAQVGDVSPASAAGSENTTPTSMSLEGPAAPSAWEPNRYASATSSLRSSSVGSSIFFRAISIAYYPITVDLPRATARELVTPQRIFGSTVTAFRYARSAISESSNR